MSTTTQTTKSSTCCDEGCASTCRDEGCASTTISTSHQEVRKDKTVAQEQTAVGPKDLSLGSKELTIYRTYQKLTEAIDQEVKILGWLRKMRTAGKIVFMELSAGLDSRIQVVMHKKNLPENLLIESYVQVQGHIRKLPETAYSVFPVELQGASMIILGTSDSNFPSICPPEAGPATRMEQRHIYLRDPQFALITKLRAQLLQAMRRHFEESGCTEIIPPCFTGIECEGGATLFKVSHPGKSTDKPMTAYLTQSSQFYLEYALPGVGDCYCIYPSFRAENSHTRRHLTEFLHAEWEHMGILTFEDHLQKLREFMHNVLMNLLSIAEKTLSQLGILDRVKDLEVMARPENILILDHKDAIQELKVRGIYKDEEKKEFFGERDDIPEAQERALIDSIGKIVFLCRFPKEFKSFYMGLDPNDTSRVLGVDVECPEIGEVIGSGVRESDYENFKQRLLDAGLDPQDYTELLDMRKYGHCKSSGAGVGVDRLLTWIVGTPSIRDVVTFPRIPSYLRP